VDRWFAICQAAHPSRWFDGQFNGDNGHPEDIAQLAKEAALPFRHPQGSYWNGDLSQDTKVFGYTYNDATGSAQEVKKNFADLYTWAVRSRTGTGKYGTPPPSMAPLNVNEAQVFKYTATQVLKNVVQNGILKAAQAVLGAVKATALATNGTPGSSWTQNTETPANAAPVDTSPVTPGTNSSSVAFSNMQPAQVAENTQNVDESKYARDWYIDNLVER
jgi:cytoskeletal protein RodZ